MTLPTYVICYLVVLAIINPAKGFLCPSFFPWCGTGNTANSNNANVNSTSTSVPQMITSPGSFCTCLLHNESRKQRDALVRDLMNSSFTDLTLSVSNATQDFVNYYGNAFDVEIFVWQQAQNQRLNSSFYFVLNGQIFFVNWIGETKDYFLSYNSLALYINQWYVEPLQRELQEIAVLHGTSVGVFRAGQTLTYDGICYRNPSAQDPYLFEQQCKINLSYLVRVSFNGACNNTQMEKIIAIAEIESSFDAYFSSKSEKFVRSATFNVVPTNTTTDVFLELFYNANSSIWDIGYHLQSMNPLSIACNVLGTAVMSVPISLVNCTWYDLQFNTTRCMPNNGTSTSANNSTQTSTSPGTQTNFAGTNPTTASAATIPSTSRTDALPTSTIQGNSNPQNPPSGSGNSTSANSSGAENSPSTQSPTQSQTSPSILTTPSTILVATNTPISGQNSASPSLTVESTTSTNTSSPYSNTSINVSTESSTASNSAVSGLNNSSAASTPSVQPSLQNQNLSSTTANPLSQSNSTKAVSGSSAGNSGATTASTNGTKTTPFDADPFFKAVVPVFTKKFNDEYLLRAVGTMRPITAHSNFYWITIPVCISAVILSMLCLMCLQVDWLVVCGGKKETENLIK